MSTGFVGRISLRLTLREFSLHEYNMFFQALGFQESPLEKFKILAVMGGIPKYLEEIKKSWSAEENTKQLCFEEGGLLFHEFNDLFSDLFFKKMDFYKNIVKYLATGAAEFNEISR